MGKYTPVRNNALSTYSPRAIKGTAKFDIYVWDDFATLKKEQITPKCYLTTIIEIPSGWNVEVNVNGKVLKSIKRRAGSQIYELPDGLTKFGKNEITLSVTGSNRHGLIPRIGNLGIDVLFNGELEALKKPGNEMIPLKDIPKKDNGKEGVSGSAKKGGLK
jgi:hypothetical protein